MSKRVEAIVRGHLILAGYCKANGYGPGISDEVITDLLADLQIWVRSEYDGTDWDTLLHMSNVHAEVELDPDYDPNQPI